MKKYLFFVILLMTVSFSFISCKKKEVAIEEKIKKGIEKHYTPQKPDSLAIVSIDTISSLGYANLMLGTLEDMRYEMEYEYKEAIFTGDEPLTNEIELSMMEIDDVSAFFMAYSNSAEAKKDDVLLYMVSINIYKNGITEPAIVFLRKDLTVHELDPFNDNLLEMAMAAID